SDLDAGADRAAPAGFAGGVDHEVGGSEEAGVLVVGDRGAALDVPEHVVPGVADLTGEEADRVDLGLVGEQRAKEGAGVRALEVSPVALRFEAEHHAVACPPHVEALPAITDLTTDEAARRVVAAFADRGNADAGKRVQRPAIAG